MPVGISRYFDETYETLWADAPGKKLSPLLEIVSQLQVDQVNLLVIHTGLENPEMKVLIDLNYSEDPFRVSRHRQAELSALCSRAFAKALESRHVKLVTYRDMIAELGLKKMHRPKIDEDY